MRKLPELAVRVSTVRALLDSVVDGGQPATSISAADVGRACHYVGEYLRQHAFEAYGAAALPAKLKAASRIAEMIKTERLRQLSTREIAPRRMVGLQSAKKIGPAFTHSKTRLGSARLSGLLGVGALRRSMQ